MSRRTSNLSVRAAAGSQQEAAARKSIAAPALAKTHGRQVVSPARTLSEAAERRDRWSAAYRSALRSSPLARTCRLWLYKLYLRLREVLFLDNLLDLELLWHTLLHVDNLLPLAVLRCYEHPHIPRTLLRMYIVSL